MGTIMLWRMWNSQIMQYSKQSIITMAKQGCIQQHKAYFNVGNDNPLLMVLTSLLKFMKFTEARIFLKLYLHQIITRNTHERKRKKDNKVYQSQNSGRGGLPSLISFLRCWKKRQKNAIKLFQEQTPHITSIKLRNRTYNILRL